MLSRQIGNLLAQMKNEQRSSSSLALENQLCLCQMTVEVNRAKISVRLQESLCKNSFWTLQSSKLSSLAFARREDGDDEGILTLRQK